MLNDARSRCNRYRMAGPASSASRSTILIGVTCDTTRTVVPWCAATIRSRALNTRSVTVSKLSPPGGTLLVSRSQRPCSSASRSAASANVNPSQEPKSVSIRSSSTVTSRPKALAAAAAVS
jgi:hypothetical protein